jgi:hypothetical protein
MFIYHRNVSVSIVVAIIRKRNNDALTNNIYSFFLEIHTDRHTFGFIYKKNKIYKIDTLVQKYTTLIFASETAALSLCSLHEEQGMDG